MILRRALAVVMTTALALPVLADNILTMPGKSNLLVLDGKNVKSLAIESKKKLSLPSGKHQIVFRLETIVKNAGDQDIFKSRPYLMTFSLQGDQKFTITLPTLRTTRDSEELAKDPAESIRLNDQSGKAVPYEFATLSLAGVQLGMDLSDEVRRFNLRGEPASVRELAGNVYVMSAGNHSMPVQTDVSLQSASANAISQRQGMSETMLKYWYNQADKETRERFLQWTTTE